MSTTLLKIAWPYLQNFLTKRAAEYAADYLQTRREQRLGQPVDQEEIEAALFEESGTVSVTESAPAADGFLSSDSFWFTMSGILLGTAFSIIATYLVKQGD